MILSDLRDEWREGVDGRWRRISMAVQWEDSSQPPRTLYFEAQEPTAALMRPGCDAFAIACLPLAAWHGEARLRVEGRLCTRLREGLPAINEVLKEWWPPISRVRIEPSEGFVPTEPPAAPATAALLSGGVDGLTCIRRNRLDYPLDHPQSIRAAVTLFGTNGFDLLDDRPRPERWQAYLELLQRLGRIAGEERFELHPVRTNVRSLAPSYRFWSKLGFGAGHTAVGQLFQGQFDRLLLASGGDGPSPPPGGGSHPRFDHHFSTESLQLVGTEYEMTRQQKLRLLLDWEPAREIMQPCHQIKVLPPGQLNCGRCVKCVRTQLLLIAEGALDRVSAFPDDDIGPWRVIAIPINSERVAGLLLQGAKDLYRMGRRDLAWAIRARLRLYRLLGR